MRPPLPQAMSTSLVSIDGLPNGRWGGCAQPDYPSRKSHTAMKLLSLRPTFHIGNLLAPKVRAVIVSTPRSGNTWLRSLLANAYALEHARNEELWAHTPEGFPWSELPRRCVMQLHWEPDKAFQRLLRTQGVRPIAVARHPLDVLISILQLSQHSTETACWLRGAIWKRCWSPASGPPPSPAGDAPNCNPCWSRSWPAQAWHRRPPRARMAPLLWGHSSAGRARRSQ